ncbi:MAG: hypothetical protein ACLPID_00445 [Beijerinckiaceae bacterium]
MSLCKPTREISDLERAARLKLQLAEAANEIAEDTRYAVFAKIVPIRDDAEAILASDTADEMAKATARAQLEEAKELLRAGWADEQAAHDLYGKANAELEVVLAECNPEFRAALIANRAAQLACFVAEDALKRVEKTDYESATAKASASKAAWARLDAANEVRCGTFNESDLKYEYVNPDDGKGTQGALHRLRKQMDDDWLFTKWAAEDTKEEADFEAMKAAEKTRLEAEYNKMATGGDVAGAVEWLARVHADARAKADVARAARDAIKDAWDAAGDRFGSLTVRYHPGYLRGNEYKYAEILATKAEMSECACGCELRDREWCALAATEDAARELKGELKGSSIVLSERA